LVVFRSLNEYRKNLRTSIPASNLVPTGMAKEALERGWRGSAFLLVDRRYSRMTDFGGALKEVR